MFPTPKLRQFISVGGPVNRATTYHARNTNARRLLRVNDDALGTTSSIGDLKIHVEESDARQIRKERLHHHLNELGVDADSLEDAAFRSVTTTGECIPGDLTIHANQPQVNSCFYFTSISCLNSFIISPRAIITTKMGSIQDSGRARLRLIDHILTPGLANWKQLREKT